MEEYKIQINTAKDRLNLVLHFGAGVAMLGVAVVCSPAIAYAGSLLSVAVLAGHIYESHQSASDCPDIRSTATKAHANSPLQRVAREIAGRLGLAKTPQIYMVTSGKDADEISAQLWHGGDIVMSAALADKTDLIQLKGIIAHEIGHRGAGHILQEAKLHLIGNAARDILIVGTVIKVAQHIGHSQTLYSAWWSFAAAAGALLVNEGVKRSFSRAAEYQADRLGAEATSPATIENSLLRLRQIDIERHGRRAEKVHDKESFSGHPTIVKRIAALRAMMPA